MEKKQLLNDKWFGGKFGKYNGDEIKYVKKFFNTENKKDKSIDWVKNLKIHLKKLHHINMLLQ